MEEKTTVILNLSDLHDAVSDYLDVKGYEDASIGFNYHFLTGKLDGCEVVVKTDKK